MNDAVFTDEAKARRNQAINFRNQVLTVVGQDKQMAYRLLCSAVTVDPTFADGWFMLGNALADLKLLPASIAAFRKALALPDGGISGDMNPELRAKALVNLGHRLYHHGELDEGWTLTRNALTMNDKLAFAWTNISMIESVFGNDALAIETAQTGYNISPTPIVEMGLAFAHLFAGNMAEGLKHFEARFAYSDKLAHYANFPYPRYDGSVIGTLVVVAEQGAGDSLCYARFLPALYDKARYVVCMAQQPLVSLLREALPGIEFLPLEAQYPVADAWVPIVSVPVALGLTTDEIVNAKGLTLGDIPKPAMVWKNPEAKFHIGIAWAGSPLNDIDHHRKLAVEDFLKLYQVDGVQLYSLQVGERAADLHSAGCAGLIRDLAPYIRDAKDTVGFMRELDLVVSVESFVAHLAAAAGVECWVPLSYLGGDYRCGRTRTTPMWAEKTVLYRQGEDMTWGPVWERIVEALQERVL